VAVVSMSKQDFSRLEVLLQVQSGRLRVADACELIGLRRRRSFEAGITPLWWTVLGLGDQGSVSASWVCCFSKKGGTVSQGGVRPQRIVPALDRAEAGHARLGLGGEFAAGEQFAFESGEEALGHGVIVGVSDRTPGGPHAGFPAALPEGQGYYWLSWSEWWITSRGRRGPTAISKASRTSSMRRGLAVARPTPLPLQASRTTAR
jgi:hypothetical protein